MIEIIAIGIFTVGLILLLEGYLPLAMGLWLITAALYGYHTYKGNRSKSSLKEEFLQQYELSDLRSANQNPNLIYKILGHKENKVIVELIWANDKPSYAGKILVVSPNALKDFNKTAFLAMV